MTAAIPHVHMLLDAEPALELARIILRDPTAPQACITLACETLAQSREWTDVALVREVRTGFWSNPHSETGDNFNRRRDLEARPLVMDTDEFLSGALEVPHVASRASSRALIGVAVIVAGLCAAVILAPGRTAELTGRVLPPQQMGVTQ